MPKKCGRNTSISKPKEVDLAWAAGVLDGEGCIHFSVYRPPARPSAKYRLFIDIQMVHLPTLLKIEGMLGGSVRPINRGAKKGNRRDIWRWSIGNKAAERILPLLLPYLITKRAEAVIALEFFALDLPKPSRRGRSQEHTSILEDLARQMKVAKRYEWKHSDTPERVWPELATSGSGLSLWRTACIGGECGSEPLI